jgi:glycerol-1-phosphate dehydrogenase [NAD(P)+]
MKPQALGRLGIYARRHSHRSPVVLASAGLPSAITQALADAFADQAVALAQQREVETASFDAAAALMADLPASCDAVLGVGGGKALDVAKYVATLADRPFYAVPTSLSNDGFCSPQSSLLLRGRRSSLTAALPFAVAVDTAVCLQAPEVLWWSGVGDLVAKLTATRDWKLAYHARGEPVNDLAALLSTASVYQFIARPARDEEGIRLLGSALMLNGISMAICGSSRPASGAEHLISHALDQILDNPRYHGQQVGLACYVVSRLQQENTDVIADLFRRTGFWKGIRQDPLPKEAWLEAVDRAPEIYPNRYTVLSERSCLEEVSRMIETDENLHGCFVD